MARFTVRNGGGRPISILRVALAPPAWITLVRQDGEPDAAPSRSGASRWVVRTHILPGTRRTVALHWSLRTAADPRSGLSLAPGRRWLVAPGWHPSLSDVRGRCPLQLLVRAPADEVVLGPGEQVSGGSGVTSFRATPGPRDIRLLSARLTAVDLTVGSRRFRVYRAQGAKPALSAAVQAHLLPIARGLDALGSLLGPPEPKGRLLRVVVLPGAPTRALPQGLLMGRNAAAIRPGGGAPVSGPSAVSRHPAAPGTSAPTGLPPWLPELARLWWGQGAAALPAAATLLEDGAALHTALLAYERLVGKAAGAAARRRVRRLALGPEPSEPDPSQPPAAPVLQARRNARAQARAAMVFETLRTRIGTAAHLAALRDLFRHGAMRLLDLETARRAIAQARSKGAAELFLQLARTRGAPRVRAWVRRFENLPSGRFVRVKVQNRSGHRALVPLVVVYAGQRIPASADLAPHAEVVLRVPIVGTMTQAAELLVDPDARSLLRVLRPPRPSMSTSPPDPDR